MPIEHDGGLDFSKMLFDISSVPPGTDLNQKFHKLGKIKEFQEYSNPDRNFVTRYILLMYESGSPLHEAYEDLSERKSKAADIAGYERNSKGKFKDERIYKIMSMEEEEINNLIFAFLKAFKHTTWMQIVTNEQIFEEYSRLLIDPVTGKDSKNILEAANVKAKLRQECKDIAADLKSLYKELCGKSQDELKPILSEKLKPITPETITKHFGK
jgi:hypothetical protein